MLADTVGLGTTHTMSGLSIALLSAPLYLTLLHFPTSTPVIVSVGIVLPAVLQASTVCGFAWITGLFPPQVRGRYVSVTFNFAGLVGVSVPCSAAYRQIRCSRRITVPYSAS
eukprot:TRINITY_DN9887_c0_g1_i1.p1 TRINITY_DN9887_c0_g1~~TRINITY_DN9887_c0_g1_i1.p1  ORF type:complete len:112 (+),score=0.81 TRINITY_DN9887_c0_g1_i1:99-434(+)